MAQTVGESKDVVDPAVLAADEILSGLRERIFQYQDVLTEHGSQIDLGSLTLDFISALITPEPHVATEATKDIVWLLTDEPKLQAQLLSVDNFPQTILMPEHH